MYPVDSKTRFFFFLDFPVFSERNCAIARGFPVEEVPLQTASLHSQDFPSAGLSSESLQARSRHLRKVRPGYGRLSGSSGLRVCTLRVRRTLGLVAAGLRAIPSRCRKGRAMVPASQKSVGSRSHHSARLRRVRPPEESSNSLPCLPFGKNQQRKTRR